MRAFVVPIKSSLVIALLVLAGLAGTPAGAAGSDAAGRRHAAKANQLSAKNKCKSAVIEFTKAYKSLKDPTLLFNRAECQRRLGNNADALKDYEQFLADMPAAPNRASVEARMAALREAVQAESAAVPVAAMPPPAPAAPSTVGTRQPPQPAQPASGESKPADKKAPETQGHRAEKWTD